MAELQTLFKTLLLMIIMFILMTMISSLPPTRSTPAPPNYRVAKPNCPDRCGDVSIPFPFGTTPNCYRSDSFLVTCNQTIHPGPKLFLHETNIEITDISLDGQLTVLPYIASDCPGPNGTRDVISPSITLPENSQITVSNTANKFTIVGCDAYAYVSGWRLNRLNYTTGCMALCKREEDLVEGSCNGVGCCQLADIPKDIWRVVIDMKRFVNYTNFSGFSDCNYAFLAKETEFNFSRQSVASLKNVGHLPMVADWAIGNMTCEEAKKNSSAYACKSLNSTCDRPKNSTGYQCRCEQGYEGNPYLIDGCQDINECLSSELNKCKHGCQNINGSFICLCRKGYRGDGENCSLRQSIMLKLVAGIAFGIISLLLAASCLYMALKRRSFNKMKQKFFLQNGGIVLQETLITRQISPESLKIFTSSELQRATNDFDNILIVGQGGFGTVYKGFLPDNSIVAIKKSKRIDPDQVEQFINEVLVLSQINHRNVVRLLGCCLETEVPLLVYEFVSNGTLSSHIHNQARARFLSWDIRLRIAAEAAGVLSYLHSAAATPIIHRDVKSDNILLDHSFTAKVSDFGASRLVPLDHTQLSTMVQGTFGKAITFDKPEEEKNLANFFLSVLKKECLLQILDDNILGDDHNREQMIEVAMLAQRCLNVRGDDRPSMKEVAMELEGMRLGGKHSWVQNECNAEEMESLLGPIPFSIGKLHKLQEIYLGANRLTHELPFSFGNLTLLNRLYLGQNNLYGNIPQSLGNCSNLLTLDLSRNNLNVSIPPEIMSLSSISIVFNLSNNFFTGSIPSEVGSLRNLVNLDLSHNRLSGSIPSSLSSCVMLERLHLDSNALNGEIPDGLRSLRGLQDLDLSQNNISGPIPRFLSELLLVNLNLSFNRLQGEVPTVGVFQNESAISLEGNSGLCGGIVLESYGTISKKKQFPTIWKILIPSLSAGVICLILSACFYVIIYRRRISQRIQFSGPAIRAEVLRLSYADLLKATGGFSEANLLGAGRFGSVYKGVLHDEQTLVAVKVLNLSIKGASKSFISEINALRGIRRRNLLKILSICPSTDFQGNDFKALVYEFMANGSLEKWLHQTSEEENRNLSTIQRLNIAIDIAFEYLHFGTVSTIVHGDLKPSNILLDENMTAHLGDFGLAKVVSTIVSRHESSSLAIKGTIGYIPPEYGMSDMISGSGDVHSYGISLLEMFTNRRPTDDELSGHSSLHDCVSRALPSHVMEVLDPFILDEHKHIMTSRIKNWMVFILGIGVACSKELPRDRMSMPDVVTELHKIKNAYMTQ
ncbi:UNVERIFIED_CONTAM: Wall-associated receptor kinase [Sesamum radiatum]|uniref:non-specific serine/threonine protein kinase n=1 Tax=Sesamum radiatum TaxID=300843 RepID=A0AAW2PX60_SESRA